MEKQKADRIITEYMQKLYGFAMKKAYSYNEAEELCAEIIKEVYVSLLRAARCQSRRRGEIRPPARAEILDGGRSIC